jgi:hypothetical protein
VIFFGPGPLTLVFLLLVVFGSLVYLGPLAPVVLIFILPPLLLFALFAGLAGRRSTRHMTTSEWEAPRDLEPPPDFEEVRRAAQDDLLALADDIRALDIDIEMPDAGAEAKRDYANALDLYERATQAFDRARAPEDLEAVSEAVEEGQFAVASAKARLEGRPPPERRPPCFFDPRHGPSVRDVEWAPPGGTPRLVPACAADAIRIEEGQEPLAREVVVHGERRAYWDAPPYFGPWAGGFFAGSGAVLPALFVGSLLGTGFGMAGPMVFGDEGYELGHDDYGGGDFDYGGGDFDYGGGDFGSDR